MKKMSRNTESWERATVKGALLWGSVYSIATAGAASWLLPEARDGIPTFCELLKNAALLFSFAGAIQGALIWRVRNGYFAFRLGKNITNA